jgi:hypothetical protein
MTGRYVKFGGLILDFDIENCGTCAVADRLRLSVELVPSTSWGDNLRRVLPSSEWDKIRLQAYAENGYRCAICGERGRLNCHERWQYDDVAHVQKLLGFIALCDWCHHVKHLGRAGILAREGKLDYERVVQHYISVNECDRSTFELHKREAFEQWRRRSRYSWTVDLGEYARSCG